jgi:hypothetical protein
MLHFETKNYFVQIFPQNVQFKRTNEEKVHCFRDCGCTKVWKKADLKMITCQRERLGTDIKRSTEKNEEQREKMYEMHVKNEVGFGELVFRKKKRTWTPLSLFLCEKNFPINFDVKFLFEEHKN